jgi:tetratricopeptide (TPR) repeat protein
MKTILRRKYLFSIWLFIFCLSQNFVVAQDLFGGLFTPKWANIDVKVPIRKQFDIKQFKKVAMGDIYDRNGNKGGRGTDAMEEFTVRLQNMGDIEILDRQYLQNLLDEHKLNSSGLVDESTAKQLGKFIGSGVLVLGRVQTDTYSSDVMTISEASTSIPCATYRRRGVYTLSVNIKLLDVEKATIIFATTINTRYVTYGTDYKCNTPPDLNRDEVYANALKSLGYSFWQTFIDTEELVNFKFDTDSKFNEELQKAITKFNTGNIEEACKIMKEIIEMPKLKLRERARAYYNLGIVQINTNQQEEGVKHLQEAYELVPTNKAYLEKYTEAKKQLKGG